MIYTRDRLGQTDGNGQKPNDKKKEPKKKNLRERKVS